MRSISHTITPRRLYLAWQGADERCDRYRYAVGEILERETIATLRYFDPLEFEKYNNGRSHERVLELGFRGYPGFGLGEQIHSDGVLSALMRRVPPQSRKDFALYRRQFCISDDLNLKSFDLLGLTEAKLPSDGFSVVDPLDEDGECRELMFEVAGFRYRPPEARRKALVGEGLVVRVEPENEVDPGAVALDCNGAHVGYVNRLQAPSFHRWLTHFELSAEIVRLNGSSERPRAFAFVSVKATRQAAAA